MEMRFKIIFRSFNATKVAKILLFYSYSAKKDGTEDTVDAVAHYAGNKGVGRFSCDRLGRYLHMEAKVKNSLDVNIVDEIGRAHV